LSAILEEKIDRNKFIVILLNELWLAMISFSDLSSDELQLNWSQWDLIKDKQVSFQKDGKSCEGVARGINASGYLLVETELGEISAFNASISKVRW
jgi:biotin-(acetyl-CoA carboxylase) ligase